MCHLFPRRIVLDKSERIRHQFVGTTGKLSLLEIDQLDHQTWDVFKESVTVSTP